MNPLARILLAIVLGDADWFQILRIGFLGDVGGESREAVTIVGILISVGLVLLLASIMHRASRPP
jgi:hypothetical protein